MSTDASYRFERGVDLGVTARALERVAQLIIALAGGSVAGAPVDIYSGELPRTPIALRTRRVAQVLGEPVPSDETAALLRRIGFVATPEPGDAIVRVDVPSWRTDVTHEIDLVEEVARLRGYDSFPDELRPFSASAVPDDPFWLMKGRVRDALVGDGLLEARALPFVRGGDDFVRVSNPLAENEAYLRREILDTLARRAEFNLSHMNGDLRLFEIGSVFFPSGTPMPREELHVGALLMGRRQPQHFTDPKSSEAFEKWVTYDVWDAKALAERVTRVTRPNGSIAFETGSGDVLWTIKDGGESIGVVRRVPLDAPVWAKPAFGLEITLGVLDSSQVAPPGRHAHREPTWPHVVVAPFRPIPTTPVAPFDLALILPANVTAAAVEDTIRRSAGELLEKLELFDEYRGEKVGGGARSVAWRLTLRHPERTLSAKEIEGRRKKILTALESELDVRQRTA